MILRLILESFGFALGALRANLLRTLLSLLGITIGISVIIGVFTMVDSLEKSIRQSLSFLGDKVIYVQKWPWAFGGDYPWWKYLNRPAPALEEMEFLEENLEKASGVALSVTRPNILVQHDNNSIEKINLTGVSHGYWKVSEVKLTEGRYFLPIENKNARNVVIIGDEIAKTLFANRSPLGKTVRIKGRKFIVIGVLEREGQNLLGAPRRDTQCLIPYSLFVQLYRVGRIGHEPTISMKGFEQDEGLRELENEARAYMRIKRGLRPTQEDNFALNRPEFIATQVDAIFASLNLVGWVIGTLAIIVGVFNIANIMFVSVKERTAIIGIQKSLGAKNYFILFQFLFESTFLSLFGGLIGIGIIFFFTIVPQDFMEVNLSLYNVGIGIFISTLAGLGAGIIPALSASRLDPVQAIRSK